MRAASVEVTTFSDLVLTARCDVRQFLNAEIHLNQVVTVSIDPEQMVIAADKTSLSVQGPVPASVTAMHQDAVETFLVLELADGTVLNATQETAFVSRLKLRQGSRVQLFFPARAVRLDAD